MRSNARKIFGNQLGPGSRIYLNDLLRPTPCEVCKDLIIWLPWLALAWLSLYFGYWYLALPCWFFFFLTGLRQAHEAFHRTMGIPAFMNDVLLIILSPLMLSSLHATRYAHLRHHKYCLAEKDIEGAGARLSALGAILKGPVYPIKCHLEAFASGGPYTKRFMILEFLFIVAFYGTGLMFFSDIVFPHLIAMIAAEWLVSFFAVWVVHHDCPHELNPSRTIRGLMRTVFSYHMFYHFEHHAFPTVPTRKLPELAKRLDAAGLQIAPRAF